VKRAKLSRTGERKLIMARAVATIACAVSTSLLLIGQASASVKVERVAYNGWRDCWKLSNGTVDLVFVPSIGRIMRYGRTGGPNVLWENPKMLGRLPVETKDWQNFGGDKLWPAPQTVWGWPPDPALDPGTHEVRPRKNAIMVIGRPSGKSGIHFEREIVMDARGTAVRIVNRMINSSAKPQKWAVWEIAQIDDPQSAVIPRSPADVHPLGYYPFPDNVPLPGRVMVQRDEVRIERDKKKSAKIGSYSERSVASSVRNGEKFTITVHGRAAQSAEYPHGGGRQEIYTNPDPDSYVELELLGPVRELKPGESSALTLTWTLNPVGKAERTRPVPRLLRQHGSRIRRRLGGPIG
jgi:hypothetical protein